jgi:hypothetical protein
MKFVVENNKLVSDLPSNASFVAFSNKDKELNKYTQKILDSLIKNNEDKPIAKAEQQKYLNDGWKFTTITP